ncbi:MAG TPA: pyridoxal phosphate-dependent aminotransferase [Candidatus Dormibacteraeota bacterium]|nr:pyridoxal phosphate-dependent aminotransferase [Candidatus Dormibacteraeota bacterium]
MVSFLAMFSQRTNWKLTPNRYAQALEELHATGTPILDLTASNPTRCGFHYDTAAILDAFRRPEALTYDPQPLGLLPAREEVSRYYLQDHRAVVNPASILLTTSTSEAYSYVFRLLCNPHDEILVPKPSYPLFDYLADLQDVALIPYTLEYAHGWFIDFHSVIRALTPRTRAILLVHPNNPTGSYLQAEELHRFNKLCRERNLALIVDEVFLDYAFTPAPRATFAGNHEVLTFTLSGLSKIAALPQMKVAWVVTTGPEPLAHSALERLEVIADTYLSLNAPTQWAFPALIEQRHSLRPQILERLRENRAHLRALLSQNTSCELLDADGGWYAVLRLPAGLSDEDFAITLLRTHHVLVHPGHFYDFSTEDCLVISLLTPPDVFREGISRLIQP